MVAQPMENNAFVPITDTDRLGVWEEPIPVEPGAGAPMVWLLGPHGGAGVTCLAHQLGIAGDARGRWPSGRWPNHESPLVLLVAAETRMGLDAMGRALRQHMAGQGSSAELVGLVTIRQSRKRPKELEHEVRRLETAPVPVWHVPFIESYRLHFPHELPVWDRHGPVQEKGRRKPDPMEHVPDEIATVGAAVVAHVNQKFGY